LNERVYNIGVLTTHPIQYQVPWFRKLAARPDVSLRVHYCMVPDARQQGAGFGVAFQWDVPLLGGYDHVELENVSPAPSVVAFFGCDTPSIREVIRDGDFDVFIVNGWVVKSCLQALFACRRHDVPCLVRGESNLLRQRSWWKRLAHRLLLRQYAGVLAIGEENHRCYLAYGVSRRRIYRTPYGVDNDFFVEGCFRASGRREDFRERWSVPQAAFTFLFCGKLEPKKRPLDFLNAVRGLVTSDPSKPCHALVVGDGELRSACEALARRHDVPVSFTGFVNQTEAIEAYVAADALVLPSDGGETWGLVVNEAMACGLPVVVSDQVGCGPDLVIPGETGLIFPCGDVSGLTEAMARLRTQATDSGGFAQRVRERVGQHSVDAVVDGVMSAVRGCAKARASRGGTGTR
jgi:glycosyltransferase involved in cell wall biosynthesis